MQILERKQTTTKIIQAKLFFKKIGPVCLLIIDL